MQFCRSKMNGDKVIKCSGLLCLLSFAFCGVQAQWTYELEERENIERYIADLILSDRAAELAQWVKYPMMHSSGYVSDPKEFMMMYPVLVDDKVRDLVRSGDWCVWDKDDHHYMKVISGLNWRGAPSKFILDESGRIFITPQSGLARTQLQKIRAEEKTALHASVNRFDYLLGYFETDQHFILITEQKKRGLRYVCWNQPKSTLAPPDLVLEDGKYDQYSVGQYDWAYEFVNEGWTYRVSSQSICADDECGWWLRLYYDNELKLEKELTKRNNLLDFAAAQFSWAPLQPDFEKELAWGNMPSHLSDILGRSESFDGIYLGMTLKDIENTMGAAEWRSPEVYEGTCTGNNTINLSYPEAGFYFEFQRSACEDNNCPGPVPGIGEFVLIEMEVSAPFDGATSRGVRLGDTYEEVFEAYRRELNLISGERSFLTTDHSGWGLRFTFEDEKLVRIAYEVLLRC